MTKIQGEKVLNVIGYGRTSSQNQVDNFHYLDRTMR